jgi:hypothetical protein
MNRVTIALGVVLATAPVPLLAQRFDNVVREDFFAGYRGDAARLARGMETCERALARDPKDAAALVWHGGGFFFQSGQKFRAGDVQSGMDLQARGLKEMDDAVALRPDDLQTLIPRGAVLLAGAPFLPDQVARPLVQKGIGDWEKAAELQRAMSVARSVHARGELLGGLAVGYRLLDDREKSAFYLRRIVDELPGSAYAVRASAWLADPARVQKIDRFCIGCHE